MASQPTRQLRDAADRHPPGLVTRGPRAGARAVILLLHGGRAADRGPADRGPAYLRMVPFARSLTRATRGDGVAVWLLRYRVRGWNEPLLDPVRDARWALDEARRLHPDAPLVLVGHSMGGRVALRLAGEPDVLGVCALAPWLEADEPVPPLNASSVLVAHGDRDRVTDPAVSAAYAATIGATFVPVPGEGHAMLRRPVFWNRLVSGFVASTLRLTRAGG